MIQTSLPRPRLGPPEVCLDKAMYMTFHSDRHHFSTNLSNSTGQSIVLYKLVADPAAEFDESYADFTTLSDILSQRGNQIIQAVLSISEAEYQLNFQQYVERFAAMEMKELAALGVAPESEQGKAAMAHAQRQVDFVKGLQGKSLLAIRQQIRLIRIEVLKNGYMLIFGNVEHEIVAMACYMTRDFERPTEEDLRHSRLMELNMTQGVQVVSAQSTSPVAWQTTTGVSLH